VKESNDFDERQRPAQSTSQAALPLVTSEALVDARQPAAQPRATTFIQPAESNVQAHAFEDQHSDSVAHSQQVDIAHEIHANSVIDPNFHTFSTGPHIQSSEKSESLVYNRGNIICVSSSNTNDQAAAASCLPRL
jgi:hypothetical protein